MESQNEKNCIDVDSIGVYGQLITEGHPQFKKMVNSGSVEGKIKRDNIVFPIFEIVFEDLKPDNNLRQMVRDSLNETISESDIQKVMMKYKSDDILSKKPYNAPNSKSVRVGDIAVNDTGDGILANYDLDALINIYDK